MMAMRNEIWRRRVASMKKLAARNADRNRKAQEGAL
jgi:heme exporter protein C